MTSRPFPLALGALWACLALCSAGAWAGAPFSTDGGAGARPHAPLAQGSPERGSLIVKPESAPDEGGFKTARIAVLNAGFAPLTGLRAQGSGALASLGNCPRSLGPRQRCWVKARWRSGARARVSISARESGAPLVVTLDGSGP